MPPIASKELPRRWFQIGLRSLLLLVTACGVWLGSYVDRVRKQKAAVQTLRDLGGWVCYDFQETRRAGVCFFNTKAKPPVPKWLLTLLGEDFFFNVAACSFDSGDTIFPRTVRASLLPVEAFPQLRELYLKSGQATDDDLRIIGTLKNLRVLYLSDSPSVTDTGIAHLASLRYLEKVTITNSQIGDESLKVLGSLPKMDTMILHFNHFSDRGLAHLQACDHLQILSLGSTDTEITDAGMPILAGLVSLETLDLQGTSVTSAGINHLKGLKNLKQLNVFGTQVSDPSSLRKALPKCKVFR